MLQPQPVLPKLRQLSRFWNKSPLHPLVQLSKVQILSTKAQFWNRLFQRPQNDDLSRMRALLSQVTSRFNLNWKPLLLLEREVKSHPKKLLRVLKRLTFKRELKIQKNTSEDNRSRGRGTTGDCRGGRRFLLNKLQFASPNWSQSWFCGIPAACVCNSTACHK